MGIALLNELQDRLHTAAIAGVGVMGEDFRLRRAVEQLEALASSAPVLGKVCQQVKPLLDPGCPSRETALMDAVSLVDAVVCTQADFQIKEEMTPLVLAAEGGELSLCRYSTLEPLIHALTTKGSGRYEVVSQAWEDKSPALQDFRLKSVLVQALGDSYSEMAELVQKILENGEDEQIIPLLKYKFNPQGGRDMVRRLAVMEKTAGAKENAFYLELAGREDASQPVRDEAIWALRLDQDNAARLAELAVTEKGNLKKTAHYALGTLAAPEADAYWQKELKKKSGNCLLYLTMNPSDVVSDALAQRLDSLLDEALALPEKEAAPSELMERLNEAFRAAPNKSTAALFAVLERTAKHQDRLEALRDKEGKGRISPSLYRREDTGLILSINSLLINGMVAHRRPEVLEAVKGLSQRTGTAFLPAGLTAWFLTQPDRAYDEFGRWLDNEKTAPLVLYCLNQLKFVEGQYQFSVYLQTAAERGEYYSSSIGSRLDIRWIQSLAKGSKGFLRQLFQGSHDNSERGGLLAQWINPDDPQSLEILREYFYSRAKNGQGTGILYALKKCGWTDFRGLVPKYLEKQSRFLYYEMYSLYRNLEIPEPLVEEELMGIASKLQKGTLKSNNKGDADRVKGLAQLLRDGHHLDGTGVY